MISISRRHGEKTSRPDGEQAEQVDAAKRPSGLISVRKYFLDHFSIPARRTWLDSINDE
jgi:hypothetical protein